MAKADSTGERALSQPRSRILAVGLVAVLATVVLAVFVWIWSTQSLSPALISAGPKNVTEPTLSIAPGPAIELATFQQILVNLSSDWQVTRLAENPKILVVEFPNLATQGLALNRLAALIEKHKAPRDRLLNDDALIELIKQSGDTSETFYFGHDYRSDALARFFTMAAVQQVTLNPDELRLRNLLLEANFLREEGGRMVADLDRPAIVTFTALQSDRPHTPVNESVDAQRREAILRHELSHGEFFTNVDYRNHCWIFWRQLSDSERRLLRQFLTEQGYDPQNEELMVNEAQAFLMHTPDDRVINADLIGFSQSQLDNLRTRFKQGLPRTIFSTIDRQ